MITVNWSQLCTELLTRIVENHLPAVDDVIMFSSVCNSWNRATRACDKLKLRENWSCQMPWLMLTDGNDDEVYSDTDSHREHRYANNVMGLDDDDDDDDDDADNDNADDDDDDADNDNDDADDADNDNTDNDNADADDDDDDADNDNVDDDDDVADNDNADDSFYTSSGEDENQLEEVQNKPYYSNINNNTKRELLNLSNNRNKCYNLSLPEIYGKACWGSRYGWIVTLGLNREMHLFNPITKAQLPLPSQTTFRYPWKLARDKTIRVMFLTKVLLLRVPENDQNHNVPWLAVAIYRSYSLVAIARPTDASWTHIKWGDGLHVFMDVIYCNKVKKLVFIDSEGDLYSYDIHNSDQPQTFEEYLQGPDDLLLDVENLEAYTYLVQSGDDLLIIARYKSSLGQNDYYDGDRNYKTMTFRVFRLSYPTRSWEELSDIGNVALFVGGNETMSVVASDGGCRSNCIYFCDEETEHFRFNRYKVGGHDLGVFNLSTKTIESIYDGNNWKSSYCSPIWFSPAI